MDIGDIYTVEIPSSGGHEQGVALSLTLGCLV